MVLAEIEVQTPIPPLVLLPLTEVGTTAIVPFLLLSRVLLVSEPPPCPVESLADVDQATWRTRPATIRQPLLHVGRPVIRH